jgi:hypothetical protein
VAATCPSADDTIPMPALTLPSFDPDLEPVPASDSGWTFDLHPVSIDDPIIDLTTYDLEED